MKQPLVNTFQVKCNPEDRNKAYEADLLKGASRPYGNFMQIEIVNFEADDKREVKTWLRLQGGMWTSWIK